MTIASSNNTSINREQRRKERGEGMQIGTLIYCFPVQGDRGKSRDNRGSRINSWVWLFSAGFPWQWSAPPRRTVMDSQTRGAHWVQKCSRADQRVALLRKKRPTKQTLYADGDPAGPFVSCPKPWAGSRADGRGIHGPASWESPCALGLADAVRGHTHLPDVGGTVGYVTRCKSPP